MAPRRPSKREAPPKTSCASGTPCAYVHLDDAVPTNNEAERNTRKAVLWCKVSLGVDSGDGARFAERMLTLAGTARRRGINLLAWLTRALQANLEGQPIPAFQAPSRPLSLDGLRWMIGRC